MLVARTGKSPLRTSDDNGADFPVCINQTQRIIQFGEQGGCDVSIVLIGFGEGGHELEGCTKGELVR